MKMRTLSCFALGSLIALHPQMPIRAQGAADLDPVVQSAIDRQVERARERAAAGAVRQAEAVQERAVERAASQAEAVQNQALERVQGQVERVQEQAAGRAGEQVERVQSRAAEQAGEQVERVRSQAADRARGQVERVEARTAERTQDRAEQAQQQAGGPGNGVPGAGNGVTPPGDGPGRAAAPGLQDDAPPALPERLSVAGQAGNAAFVEITVEPNVRAIEFEWVMLVNGAQRQQLNDEAPELLEFLVSSSPFNATGSELLTFRVPPDLDADGALLELLPDSLEPFIDRNHVYSAQSEEPAQARRDMLALPMSPVCGEAFSLGMIDSDVDTAHPAFKEMAGRGGRFHRQNFTDPSLPRAQGHGTAVAALLVGEGGELRPLLPGATLYSAAVMYSREAYGEGTTVLQLLQALDWLIAQDPRVVNMSLAGPDNKLLARGVEAAAAAGKVIVAAAGNEGPHAPPLYPAAYEGVISATAVARDASIYRWANQGDYIDYAALGVSVPTARGDGGFGPESGTSLAAPVVSAFLACALERREGNLEKALADLQSRLLDLGEPGRDPVFGHGLLHP